MAKRVKQPHGGEISLLEKGETANPNGRPPKVFSAIIKEWKAAGFEPATPTRVREVYEYLLSLPLKQVIEMAGNPKEDMETNLLPSLMRIVAKQMIGAKGREMIVEMLDRAHGKPKQTTDITSGGDKLPFTGYEIIKALGADQQDGAGAKQEGRPKDE